MKKKISWSILSLFAVFSLFSCKASDASSQEISTVESDISSQVISSKEDSSIEESSLEEVLPETYKTSSWDETVSKMIDVYTDNGSNYVPKLNGSNYYVYHEFVYADEEKTKGEYVTYINVYGVDVKKVVENYELSLKNSSFMMGGGAYAYTLLSETDDLIVQYQLVSEAIPYFEIGVYQTKTRILEIPNNQIELIIGEEVPEIEASSYSFYMTNNAYTGEVSFTLYANNVDENAFNTYISKLRNDNGYQVENVYEEGTYIALSSSDGFIKQSVYNTTDEYLRRALMISGVSKWPYYYQYIGLGETLPRFNTTYDEDNYYYTFSSTNSNLLYIYLNNQSSNAVYNEYLQSLKDVGWDLYDSSKTGDNIVSYFKKSVINPLNGEEKEVDFGVAYGIVGEETVPSIIMIIDVSQLMGE